METGTTSKDQENRREPGADPGGSPKGADRDAAVATPAASPPAPAVFPTPARAVPKFRRRVRRIAALLGGALVLAIAVAGWMWWRFESRLQRVEPSAGTAFRWPYYVYVSDKAAARGGAGAPVHMLVLPNNTGSGNDDFSVHERAAWFRTCRDSSLADELEVVVLVPIFPRPAKDWQVYTHALDRDCLTTDIEGLERLDLQLLAMIDHARADLGKRGWKVEERVLLKGFSANGMFADRFTALHPERVLGTAVGSPGGWPIAPAEIHESIVLRYPVGVADLEELTGRPFDREAFAKVPLLVFMGDQDTNDSLQFGDGYDTEDKDLVELVYGATPIERWDDTQAIHQAAGAKATFRLYAGVGHEVTGEMDEEVEKFLGGVLAEARSTSPSTAR